MGDDCKKARTTGGSQYSDVLGLVVRSGEHEIVFHAGSVTEVGFGSMSPAAARFWAEKERATLLKSNVAIEKEELEWDDDVHGEFPPDGAAERDVDMSPSDTAYIRRDLIFLLAPDVFEQSSNTTDVLAPFLNSEGEVELPFEVAVAACVGCDNWTWRECKEMYPQPEPCRWTQTTEWGHGETDPVDLSVETPTALGKLLGEKLTVIACQNDGDTMVDTVDVGDEQLMWSESSGWCEGTVVYGPDDTN